MKQTIFNNNCDDSSVQCWVSCNFPESSVTHVLCVWPSSCSSRRRNKTSETQLWLSRNTLEFLCSSQSFIFLCCCRVDWVQMCHSWTLLSHNSSELLSSVWSPWPCLATALPSDGSPSSGCCERETPLSWITLQLTWEQRRSVTHSSVLLSGETVSDCWGPKHEGGVMWSDRRPCLTPGVNTELCVTVINWVTWSHDSSHTLWIFVHRLCSSFSLTNLFLTRPQLDCS